VQKFPTVCLYFFHFALFSYQTDLEPPSGFMAMESQKGFCICKHVKMFNKRLVRGFSNPRVSIELLLVRIIVKTQNILVLNLGRLFDARWKIIIYL